MNRYLCLSSPVRLLAGGNPIHKNMRKIFSTLLCATVLCAWQGVFGKSEKPKYIWIDSQANFERFSHKDSICYYLGKIRATGFNTVVVDVRSLDGRVNYKSDLLPASRPGLDWDYLQFFIDEAHKRGMEVCVSVVVFPAGRPFNRTGTVYNDSRWDGKTAVKYTPSGLVDIRNDSTEVATFLNPALPEVQEYCLSFIKEIAEKYDFEAFALDYCRYSGVESDFSEASRRDFERYIGRKVEHFPEDIFTWQPDGTGKYYVSDGPLAPLWYEYRSGVISSFIRKAGKAIKSVKPSIRLEYWAASWYGSLYRNGQNWASTKYDPSTEYPWASPGYKNTGFADALDRFMDGAYLERVYGADDAESMEFAYNRGKQLIKGDNLMLGSIYAIRPEIMEEAAYLSLKQTGGLVVFDIVQVIQNNLWDAFKRGIDRAELEAD